MRSSCFGWAPHLTTERIQPFEERIQLLENENEGEGVHQHHNIESWMNARWCYRFLVGSSGQASTKVRVIAASGWRSN